MTIEHIASHLFKRYIHIFDGTEGIEQGIRPFDLRLVEIVPRPDLTGLAQHAFGQQRLVDKRVLVVLVELPYEHGFFGYMARVVVQVEVHLSDAVACIDHLSDRVRHLLGVIVHLQFHRHFMGIVRTVGAVVQHRFVEVVIAVLPHERADTFAFFVQFARIEPVAVMNETAFGGRRMQQVALRELNRIVADIVRLVRRHEIRQFDLAFLNDSLGIDLHIEVPSIHHRLLELLHRYAHEIRVVDLRRFAHFVCILRQALLGLRRRIGRSGVVNMQLQLPETENLRVLFLPQEMVQAARRLVFGVYDSDLRLIEQVLVFGHILRGVTAREQHD